MSKKSPKVPQSQHTDAKQNAGRDRLQRNTAVPDVDQLNEVLSLIEQFMPDDDLGFPPIILPSREALEASAAASPVVAGLANLAKSVDMQGGWTYRAKQLTESDWQSVEAALGLAALFDEQTSGHREVVLEQLWRWAVEIGVIDIEAGRVNATKTWLDIDSANPVDLLESVIRVAFDDGPYSSDDEADEFLQAVDDNILGFLSALYVDAAYSDADEENDEGVAQGEIVEAAREFGGIESDLAAAVAKDLIRVTALLGLVDSVDEYLRLTPAGRHFVREIFDELGCDTPAVGEYVDENAEALLHGIMSETWPVEAEIQMWLEARKAQSATDEILEAIAITQDPLVRFGGVAALDVLDSQLVADGLSPLLDSPARPYAIAWLETHPEIQRQYDVPLPDIQDMRILITDQLLVALHLEGPSGVAEAIGELPPDLPRELLMVMLQESADEYEDDDLLAEVIDIVDSLPVKHKRKRKAKATKSRQRK